MPYRPVPSGVPALSAPACRPRLPRAPSSAAGRYRGILHALAFLCALAGFLAPGAASPPAPSRNLILAWADDLSGIQVRDAGGSLLPADLGMALPPGSTIVCSAAGGAELEAPWDRSLVRLAPGARFRYDRSIAEGTGEFSLLRGKIRILADKSHTGAVSLKVRTPLAAAGVRGTDFVLVAEGPGKDWICVKEGAVVFTQTATATEIMIRTGEYADAAYADFRPRKATDAELARIFAGMDFHQSGPRPAR